MTEPRKERDVLDTFEDHLVSSESILTAITDMAECGRADAEGRRDQVNNERFIAIMDLLTMYRKGNSKVIEKLYRARRKAA